MRILVTGGGGFLGRHIVRRLLERGDAVTILGRTRHPDLEKLGVTMVEGNIASRESVLAACQGQDVVYHVAALAGIWGRAEDYFRTNVEGSRHVIAGCRKAGVSKLIYTSTPSVVFTGEPFRNADESLPYGRNWLCHYARTKAAAEAEILAANDSDLRTVALRPHLIWGVGDNHLIPRVVERARAGRLRMVGSGANQVDIIHVENAASAHLLAEQALDEPGRCDGKAYFLSQGKPVVLWDWINDLLRRLDIPPVKKRLSLRKAYCAGAALESFYRCFGLRREPPMTRFLAVELAKDHYFDISAARRDLGYLPIVDTEKGVRELVKHLKGKMIKRLG